MLITVASKISCAKRLIRFPKPISRSMTAPQDMAITNARLSLRVRNLRIRTLTVRVWHAGGADRKKLGGGRKECQKSQLGGMGRFCRETSERHLIPLIDHQPQSIVEPEPSTPDRRPLPDPRAVTLVRQ